MLRPTPRYERIAFVASPAPEARKALQRLARRYGNVSPSRADVVVALGGDGLMLQTLRKAMKAGKPIYGMHRGTIGFLMNEFHEAGLRERLHASQTTIIHPLVMRVRDIKGKVRERYAINEVSLFRQTYQVARLAISIDGKERLPELMGDGVLVSTPAGSTAYNLSAQGPIIPINASLLALTPISPFRPRRAPAGHRPRHVSRHRSGAASGRRRRRPRGGAFGARRRGADGSYRVDADVVRSRP